MDLTATLRSYDRRASRHTHEHHQLVVALQGRLNMQIGTHCNTAHALQTAVIRAGEAHSFEADGANRFLVVDLATDDTVPGRIERRLWERVAQTPFQMLDPCLANDLEELNAGHTPRVEQIGRHLYCHLLARVGGHEQLVPRMQAALRHARANYRTRLGVVELARCANLEVSQFHKLFRLYTGRSPHRYLQELRAHQAAAALRASGSSIADIAVEFGYPDQSAMTRAIKRHFGTTPGALRRRQTA